MGSAGRRSRCEHAYLEAQGTGDVSLSRTETTLAKQLAEVLDQYDNGLIGPGHCSE